MSCCIWKCVPIAIFRGVDISEVPGCHLLQQMSFQWESQKLLLGLVSHELSLPFCFRPIVNSMNYGLQLLHSMNVNQITLNHNSLKLSFINIWGLHLNFIKYESFLHSNSPNTFGLRETNLDDSIDSGNFFVRGYLSLIPKDSVTHMHGLAFCLKE